MNKATKAEALMSVSAKALGTGSVLSPSPRRERSGRRAQVPHSPARERITKAAFGLFYRQGCRATGINQVIAESGVAKASFYDHFPSKDDLVLEYARETAREEFEAIQKETAAFATPEKRLYAPFDVLVPWLQSTHYRGCPFQNLAAELAPDSKALRDVAAHHRDNLRSLFERLIQEFASSPKSPKRLRTAAVKPLANSYLLLFEGAVATCVAYQADWPVAHAKETLRTLIS